MTTETILTDEQIRQAVQCLTAEMSLDGETLHLKNVNGCIRAIEQAVLQSTEIQALLAERDALRGALTELCDEIDKHEIHAAISKTSISWFKRKARAALAQEES